MSLYFRELKLQENQTLTEAELIDLKKLDNSFSEHIYDSLIPRTNSTTQIVTYVAWFNGHILAAVQMEFNQSNQTTAEIIFFKVRNVTLRRGVGTFLLDAMIEKHPYIQHWEFMLPESLNEAAAYSVKTFVDAYIKKHINDPKNMQNVRLSVKRTV